MAPASNADQASSELFSSAGRRSSRGFADPISGNSLAPFVVSNSSISFHVESSACQVALPRHLGGSASIVL